MSKVIIAGDASGTGTFTISAPNGNTDRVLSLPDEAGTVLTTAGVPASAMPAGSVIQVVQGTTINQTSTTSTSYVTTTLGASITPSSTSSKILVLITTSYTQGQANYGAFFTVFKNGSDLISSTGFGNWYNNSGVYRGGIVLSYLDSPATTSSTTYALGIKSESASYTVSTPSQSGALGVITLMEIAG